MASSSVVPKPSTRPKGAYKNPLDVHSRVTDCAPFKKSEKYTHMLRGLFVFISNKVDASSLSVPGTYSVIQPSYVAYPQNVSAYDFSGSDYSKDQPYDVCGTNPVIEKYFSKYGRGDLISYETINEVFENPEQLADLRTTVDKILKDLRDPLEQMPAQVKEMVQGGVGSSVKIYASSWIGYFNGGTGYKLSTFLSQNENSLLFPAEFFSKYTDFLLKHITKEIAGYGDQYGIPDELFERLGLLNEFDRVATVCGEHDWEVPIDRVLSVINKSILDSYGHLSTMLRGIKYIPSYYDYKNEMWTNRAKAYKYFIAKTKVSIYKIMGEISDIQNEASPESPRGIIQSDSIYDVTSPSNKAGQSEDIDMDHLKGVIKKLNDANFNSSNRDERMKKIENIDEITHLGDGYYTFKYSVDSKTYFLKLVSFGEHSSNNNDILFETLDSPYIAKTYRILYNHVAFENVQAHDRFWVVSEFLDIPLKSLDGRDMGIVRQLASDVLNGLDYLQVQGVVHGDLFVRNVQAKQAQINGQGGYRFKIIDFGLSYSLSEAKSLADTPDTQHCVDLASGTRTDLVMFKEMIQSFARAPESKKVVFDDFVSKCEKESGEKKPNMKRLLQHPFITGKPFGRSS